MRIPLIAGLKPGASIAVSGVYKSYPDGVEALKNVSLTIGAGERVALVGPPSAGKSTLLSIIAGNESVSVGEVSINGHSLTELPSKERDDPTLLRDDLHPDLTVYENLSRTPRPRTFNRIRTARAIKRISRSLGIQAVLDRHPVDLSPPERATVILAKAMVSSARAYLVDQAKPLLEEGGVQRYMAARKERRPPTLVCAMTDPQEAIDFGDRVAVMYAGTLQQVGEPSAILNDPQTLNVARIVAPSNSGFLYAEVEDGDLRLPDGQVFTAPAELRDALTQNDPEHVVLRVQDNRLGSGSSAIRSYPDEPRSLSPEFRQLLEVEGPGRQSRLLPFDPGRILAFDADTGNRLGRDTQSDWIGLVGGESVAEESTTRSPLGAFEVRSINAWLVGAKPPLFVGQEVPIGFNIGPLLKSALVSATFSEPDWGGLEEIECDVILLADRCEVVPAGHRLTVPNSALLVDRVSCPASSSRLDPSAFPHLPCVREPSAAGAGDVS